MRVAIFTEGGRKIGFGHITRCLSLYQAFQERRGDSTKSINKVVKSVKKLKRMLKKELRLTGT